MKFNLFSCLFLGLLLELLLKDVQAISASPTWISSPLLQSSTVIIRTNTTTYGTTSTTAIATFNPAFALVPSVAYGIKNYRGNLFFYFQVLILFSIKILF